MSSMCFDLGLSGISFGRGSNHAGAVSSGHHTRRHLPSVCPLIGDVNFDHGVKVVSRSFHHLRGIFLLIIRTL